jgi:hypothetical protein
MAAARNLYLASGLMTKPTKYGARHVEFYMEIDYKHRPIYKLGMKNCLKVFLI